MKKRLLIGLVAIIGGVWTIPSSFSYACTTCISAPTHLETYFSVMDELIEILSTNPMQGEDEGEGSDGGDEGGEGEGGEGNNSSLVQFEKFISNQRGAAENLLSTILKSPININPLEEMKMMFSGKARSRDRFRLTAVDTKIIQAILQAQLGGYLPAKLEQEQYEQIDTALQKLEYIKLKQKGGNYNMAKAGANYAQYAGFLWQFNQTYKAFHHEEWYDNDLKDVATGFNRVNTEDPEKSEELYDSLTLGRVYKKMNEVINDYFLPLTNNRSGESIDWFEFEDDRYLMLVYIWDIQDQYECASGAQNQCNGEWVEAIDKARDNVEDVFKEAGGNAMNTFKEAFSRLMGALYLGSASDREAAEQRQTELLTSIYGRDMSDAKKRREGIGDAVQGAPTTLAAIGRLFGRVARNTTDFEYSQTSATPGWVKEGLSKIRSMQDTDKQSTASTDSGGNTGNSGSLNNKKQQVVGDGENSLKEVMKDVDSEAYTESSIDTRSISQASNFDRQVASLKRTYSRVLEMQDKMTERSAFNSPYELTKQFPSLSKSVYKNKKMLMQENKDADGLYGVYNAMGYICEEQCSNLGVNCW